MYKNEVIRVINELNCVRLSKKLLKEEVHCEPFLLPLSARAWRFCQCADKKQLQKWRDQQSIFWLEIFASYQHTPVLKSEKNSRCEVKISYHAELLSEFS